MGNRLRCVAATIEYARNTHRKVFIDWCDGMFAAEKENAFNKYFCLRGVDSVDSYEQLYVKTFYPSVFEYLPKNESIYNHFVKKQIGNRFVRKGCQYFFLATRKLGINRLNPLDTIIGRTSHFYQCFQLTDELQKKYGETGIFEFGDHLMKHIHADAVLYCDNIPFYKEETMLQHIALKPEIKAEVDKFVDLHNLNCKTIGVHVRASGKKCYGNIRKFSPKLKRFMEENDYEQIFLCTDSAEIESLFIQEYADKVVVQQKTIPAIKKGQTGIHDFARDSNDNILKDRLIKEAIIDMFALARTSYLFYQLGSTFSEISKVYHSDKSKCKAWTLFH